MTDITVEVSRNHYHVVADDHADDSAVCAGISALVQMLGGCINNHDDVKIKTFDIKPGHIEYEFISSGWKVLEDVKAMVIGILQIQQGYPGNVKITENIF